MKRRESQCVTEQGNLTVPSHTTKGSTVTQAIFDSLVMRLLEQDRKALRAVVANLSSLNERCTLGFAPLFATCYCIWTEGTVVLLDAGARMDEVGLGCGAVAALAMGFKDLTPSGRESARVDRAAIEMMLRREPILMAPVLRRQQRQMVATAPL
jgi:hypothetical protein